MSRQLIRYYRSQKAAALAAYRSWAACRIGSCCLAGALWLTIQVTAPAEQAAETPEQRKDETEPWCPVPLFFLYERRPLAGASLAIFGRLRASKAEHLALAAASKLLARAGASVGLGHA